MAGMATGFLAERLAKATAIPAEQRSADVRAFIETCRLQEEVVEELRMPEVLDANVLEGLLSRWSVAAALKLIRSHFVSLGGSTLKHAPQLHTFALTMLHLRTRLEATGNRPSDRAHELTELLEGDPSLETFATLAGLPSVKKERGTFGMKAQ